MDGLGGSLRNPQPLNTMHNWVTLIDTVKSVYPVKKKKNRYYFTNAAVTDHQYKAVQNRIMW